MRGAGAIIRKKFRKLTIFQRRRRFGTELAIDSGIMEGGFASTGSPKKPGQILLFRICKITLLLLVTLSLPSRGLAAEIPAPTAAELNDPFCTVSPEALEKMAPSTRKMAFLLERLARQMKPRNSIFMNRERASLFKQDIGNSTNEVQRAQLQALYALELLNAGNSEEAVEAFQTAQRMAQPHAGTFGEPFMASLVHYEAVGYLRIAEQQNCLTNHNPESCILPISGEGVHKLQEGSRKAIARLQARLEKAPRDRTGAWLLNLAYMTVGEYPNNVPLGWRLPEKVFRSDYDIKKFPDIAGDLGLDVNGFAGGTIAEDFDGDGDLDLMLSDWSPRGPMHYFVNNGDGTFSDQTVDAGLAGLVGGLHIVQGDYNNDGRPDVLVLRGGWQFTEGHHPDSLLRNDGNNRFTDVTEEAGLLAFHPNQSAVWFDYNSDGWLDLYVGNESSEGDPHPCKLYRNNRDGTFTECALESGVANIGLIKGVTSADYNNDGRPDLYLSRRGQSNVLYRNDGPVDPSAGKSGAWKFTDVSYSAGVTEPIESFPTWFFDFNNDGFEDLFVAGYHIQNIGDMTADYLQVRTSGTRARLYRNNGNGTFSDVSEEAGLDRVLHTMGSNYGDFDNDGWLDMYLGTGDPDLANLMPNRAFRNNRGQEFQDVTTSGSLGQLQKGHGVSFADFDHDGDQDVYHCVGGAFQGDFYRNALFENPGHGNNWVALKLNGTDSNAVGIGARITVLVDEEGEAGRKIHRTVSTGGSFGANPLRQQIGLGRSKRIQRLEVTWPVTGKTQVFTNLAVNRLYLIKENEPAPTATALRAIPFKKGAPGKKHLHISRN